MGDSKITILEDGPYLVSGGVPLDEKVMVSAGQHREYQQGREFAPKDPQQYALCRCGQSKNAPFCDGSHVAAGFNGSEVASTLPFAERVEVWDGPTLQLLDDNRCAFARFCHRSGKEVWTLTEESDDPAERADAILAAVECPAGRLEQHDKTDNGKLIEPELEPRISILQDPERGVSAPLYVQGGIPLISAQGEQYELRNRYTLCRCGASNNKPFCDARHINAEYLDGLDSPS
ncbi:MAG: CDGSH iron-sulfur domain-containing protein [Coriobacteriales bacterium]|jgi:CDGSH-type Zn-finger protein|nr:CDGSH iron-sulfur domain-containing protein [Coriobacteriales bacterium]